MTQGNPFGRAPARWMTETKLRALFNAGLTYDEIAQVNERSEGWRPSRSAVKRKYDAMGEPARRSTHLDLLPWKVKPEHQSDLLRHMLGAESRARQHVDLSETDRKLVNRLNELLFGRGKLMVVGYHAEIGFYLVERQDWDEDIIRNPRAPDAYSGESPLRRAPEAPVSDGDGGSPAPRSAARTRRQSATVQREQESVPALTEQGDGGKRRTRAAQA